MELNGIKIGKKFKPYIIAELSGNHSHNLDKAIAMVDIAADCGADCIKLQTYTADTITIDCDKQDFMTDADGLWGGQTLYSLYQKAHTPWEWHEKIFSRCKEKGITCFSTPFDSSAVDFLENLNVPFYKIASFEIVDTPLLIKIAKTKKPVIMSTGMANIEELNHAVETLRSYGCTQLALLKCTSSYPASPEDSNLLTIPDLSARYNCEVGISDHTLGIGVAIASIALGGRIIEKHFTLDRKDGGIDAAFSIEPYELRMLVDESERAWQSLGQICYEMTEKEKISARFRKSIYIINNIKKGEEFTPDNIRSIRPGFGMSPRFYYEVLGKKANRDIERGTPLSEKYIE